MFKRIASFVLFTILAVSGSAFAWNLGGGGGGTSSGGSGISNVVEDTTPELGGNLDGQGKTITNVGSMTVVGTFTTTSAVKAGSLTLGTPVSANGDVAIASTTASSMTVTVGTSTLVVGKGSLEYNGVAVGGSGDVVKAGTQTLTGGNDFTGSTTFWGYINVASSDTERNIMEWSSTTVKYNPQGWAVAFTSRGSVAVGGDWPSGTDNSGGMLTNYLLGLTGPSASVLLKGKGSAGTQRIDFETGGVWTGSIQSAVASFSFDSKTNSPLIFKTQGTERIRILGASSNTGIGTDTPASRLDIFGGSITVRGTAAGLQITQTAGQKLEAIVAVTTGTTRIVEVNSASVTLRVPLFQDQPPADYVFKSGYDLLPIEAVESHIKQYGHLPTYSSGADISGGKVSSGEFNRQTQETVETLFLYMKDAHAEIKMLKKEIELLKRK